MTDWSDGDVHVLVGDVRARLAELPDASVDAVVTDPPAGIAFMGAAWDTFPTRQRPAGHVFSDGRSRPGIAAGQEHRPGTKRQFIDFLADAMAEALRVAKPGALGLVWAIPRTAHWTADALEEAGWEIHPNGFIAHHFASGFPKAKTHLKPATEVWWLVRKPGPGGLRIEDCRIPMADAPMYGQRGNGAVGSGGVYNSGWEGYDGPALPSATSARHDARGRWPANLVLSHADGCNGECEPGCPVAELDRQSGTLTSGFMAAGTEREGLGYRGGPGSRVRNDTIGDSGGASRFFYVAKASATERSAGLPPGQRNLHPTVKPIALMRWLCRLVTPPGGLVLDPFMGSGSTGCAAVLEGLGFVGIEQDEQSVRTAIARLQHWRHQPALFELAPTHG